MRQTDQSYKEAITALDSRSGRQFIVNLANSFIAVDEQSYTGIIS